MGTVLEADQKDSVRRNSSGHANRFVRKLHICVDHVEVINTFEFTAFSGTVNLSLIVT